MFDIYIDLDITNSISSLIFLAGSGTTVIISSAVWLNLMFVPVFLQHNSHIIVLRWY